MCSTCIPAVFAEGSSSSPPRPSRSATSRSRFLASAPTSRGFQERDLPAVGWAIVAMTIAIILYDQLLFRPMVAWADKFRFEQTASQMVPKSAVLDLFRRSRLLKRLGEPIAQFLAAFPANLLFPVAVFFIVHFDLAPGIWLSPLTRPSRNQTG